MIPPEEMPPIPHYDAVSYLLQADLFSGGNTQLADMINFIAPSLNGTSSIDFNDSVAHDWLAEHWDEISSYCKVDWIRYPIVRFRLCNNLVVDLNADNWPPALVGKVSSKIVDYYHEVSRWYGAK